MTRQSRSTCYTHAAVPACLWPMGQVPAASKGQMPLSPCWLGAALCACITGWGLVQHCNPADHTLHCISRLLQHMLAGEYILLVYDCLYGLAAELYPCHPDLGWSQLCMPARLHHLTPLSQLAGQRLSLCTRTCTLAVSCVSALLCPVCLHSNNKCQNPCLTGK